MKPENQSWKDEAYKAYVAKWEAEEAAASASRQASGQVAIWLEPGDEDAPVFSREQQAELSAFVGSLRDQAIQFEAPVMALDAADAVGGYTGQFVIEIAAIAAPIISAALVTWINGKFGRKVRIEFYPDGTPKKIEAHNPDQIAVLLAAVREAALLPKNANPE